MRKQQNRNWVGNEGEELLRELADERGAPQHLRWCRRNACITSEVEECRVHVSTACAFQKDSYDAWIFDVPYYKKNGYGWVRRAGFVDFCDVLILCLRLQGLKLNATSMEEWVKQGKGKALEHSLKFFNELKGMGVHIILVSSRRERLRSAALDNLLDVGFHGWKTLILSLPFLAFYGSRQDSK